MNSSPISNCQHSKSAIFISHNINSNINSLLRLRVGTHYIYIYIYIRRALHTGSGNENNITKSGGARALAARVVSAALSYCINVLLYLIVNKCIYA